MKSLTALAESLGAKASIYRQDQPLGTGHAIMCAEPSLSGPAVIAYADTLIRENGGNTTLFGRIYADLFDKEGIKSSMLYSDSAIVYTNSDSIKAFGNVLIESLKGYKLLTDEIILFNNSNLVKSNKDIIFTSNSNDTLYGTGFWSNFDMSNSQIQSPKGSMTK